MNIKLVTYIRVSTEKQGASGLGLEAQKTSVEDFAKSIGATIESTFIEVESGKRADRPELAKAVAHARRIKARLCIAKLDRLSRNLAFLSALMDSGCDFVCCDNPSANRLTLHVLAAVAENEARCISERTTAALQAAKARGTLLGSARPGHWTGREVVRLEGLVKAREFAAIAKREKAIAGVADLLPEMRTRRTNGETLTEIATALNNAGQRTTRGNLWTANGIRLALERASANT